MGKDRDRRDYNAEYQFVMGETGEGLPQINMTEDQKKILEQQRAGWLKKHYKAGATMDEMKCFYGRQPQSGHR